MKSSLHRAWLCVALLLALVIGLGEESKAQTYPVTTPTYIPNGVLSQQSLTAAGDLYFNVQNTNAVSLRLSGTHGTLAAAVRVSNDPLSIANASATWTTVFVAPVGGNLASKLNAITANGLYLAKASGMTRVNVHVTTMASGTLLANLAGSLAAPAFADDVADPCQSPSVPKSSAIINIGAATTTKIVDTSASTVIYVCSFHFSLAGTTPTFVFKTGTKASTDCDTAAVSLSGTYAPTTGLLLALAGPGVLMQSIAAGQLCGTTTGTGSSAQGVLTYVQQ